ncbi:hypothetical protein RUM43_013788 [Polyplax serrata]|uniref:Protein kinase domain-containing protein n=1 Tax=Polyplax serrata TaxID=468196 RepID=A0AAN8S6X3_POLSC
MSDNSTDGPSPVKKIKRSDSNNEQSNDCKEGEKNVLSSSKADLEAGSYFLGPPIKKCVRSPVTVRLGRKKGTDEYYLMKILVLDDSNTSDRGLYIRRTVFHNEYAILSLLKHQEGIIQLHDFFKDYIYKEVDGKKQKLKRVCMAMECVFPHGPYNSDLIPLNHFLKEEKSSETEALVILHNLLSVIKEMHKSNIVHREIKLSNIILNRKTLKVKLMDFYYAKVISSNTELEPVKPLVSSCLPKTNDVWAAGVVFYALLCSICSHGLPKFSSLLSSVRSTQDLYLKLEENKCAFLKNTSVTVGTKEILCCILCSLPQYRLKASDALDMVSTLLAIRSSSHNPSLHIENRNTDQIVPECAEFDYKNQVKTNRTKIRTVSNQEKTEKKEENLNSIEEKRRKIEPNSSFGTCTTSKDKLSTRDNIRYAMKRLGATSLNSINALSFNYGNRNSCPT